VKKILIFLIAIITFSVNGFSQAAKPLYAFCGKSGECTVSFTEFKKCIKELTKTDKDLKIISFVISAQVMEPETKQNFFEDHPNQGNDFSKTTIEWLEKVIKEQRLINNRFLIEDVKIEQDGKIIKAPGMIIKLE
jgi:enhancing lycopene biosynthesis protein 2